MTALRAINVVLAPLLSLMPPVMAHSVMAVLAPLPDRSRTPAPTEQRSTIST